MGILMPSLNIMLKPASSACNLNCTYCFYADEAKNRDVESFGMMTAEVAEQIARRAMEYAYPSCSFCFQGGEPTLRGVDFFRQFTEMVDSFNTRHIRVDYAIQTNGTLLDEEWIQLFKEKNFLVGISMDGIKDIHDQCRKTKDGKGTFQEIMKNCILLKKNDIPFNILLVVTQTASRHAGQIYRFFMKNGFFYQQYIPCLEPFDSGPGNQKYSLTAAAYERFLKELFDVWYLDRSKGTFVYIQYFENLAGMLQGKAPDVCGMQGICQKQIVLEADGSAYPCDFYMLDRYKLGNICTDSIQDLLASETETEFIRSSLKGLEKCQQCRYAGLCRGGCRRHRESYENIASGENRFCTSYQNFFEYALPRLKTLI